MTAKTVAGEHLTTQNLYNSFIVGDRTYQGLADAVEPVTGITNGAEKQLMLCICQIGWKFMVPRWMERKQHFLHL